jgi:hypothetical protein
VPNAFIAMDSASVSSIGGGAKQGTDISAKREPTFNATKANMQINFFINGASCPTLFLVRTMRSNSSHSLNPKPSFSPRPDSKIAVATPRFSAIFSVPLTKLAKGKRP